LFAAICFHRFFPSKAFAGIATDLIYATGTICFFMAWSSSTALTEKLIEGRHFLSSQKHKKEHKKL
jgi:hypothetical protein